MQRLLNCRVRRGSFSEEYGILVETADGPFFFVVDRSVATTSGDLANGDEDEVDGTVQVAIVSSTDDSSLVQLPATAAHRSRVWVSSDQLTPV